MSGRSVEVIVAPFHVGLENLRVGAGPQRILDEGLVHALESRGASVTITRIPAIEEVGELEGEIGRSFEVMRRVSRATAAAVQAGRFPLVLAGNCNTTVGGIAGLNSAGLAAGAPEGADVVWFDAHPDFDTPDETTSGYFDVNGVAILAGQCWHRFAESVPGFRKIDLARFHYVGLRDFSGDAVVNKVKSSGVSVVWGGNDTPSDGFAGGLAKDLDKAKGATSEKPSCFVHFDVDSLDTSVGIANHAASSGGLSHQDVISCAGVVKDRLVPIGMTVASFDPSYEGAKGIASAAIAAAVGIAI